MSPLQRNGFGDGSCIDCDSYLSVFQGNGFYYGEFKNQFCSVNGFFWQRKWLWLASNRNIDR